MNFVGYSISFNPNRNWDIVDSCGLTLLLAGILIGENVLLIAFGVSLLIVNLFTFERVGVKQ